MNIDTVETVTSESKVDASGAADILGTSGNTDKYWSASQWGYSSTSSQGTAGTVTSYTAQSPSDTFEIAEVNGKSRVRTMVERDAYRVFKNDPGYFTNPTKAEYDATFGVQMVSSSQHGEGWFWFKLSEDNKNGWAVVFDNHSACGPFLVSNYMLYLVQMVNGSFKVLTDSSGSYYSATVTAYDSSPEYKVKVVEEDGKANINIHPNNSASTINGSSADLNWNNIDVKMDVPTTQALAFYKYNGIYFQDVSASVEATVVKSFGDIVYEPEWTDGALHMLINMDTKADSTMLGQDGGLRIYKCTSLGTIGSR